jgi:hypothetical protein
MRLASAVEHVLMLDDVAIMDDEFFLFVFHYTYRSKREEMLDGLWRKKSLEPDDEGTNRTASKLDKRNYNKKRSPVVSSSSICPSLIRISEESGTVRLLTLIRSTL